MKPTSQLQSKGKENTRPSADNSKQGPRYNLEVEAAVEALHVFEVDGLSKYYRHCILRVQGDSINQTLNRFQAELYQISCVLADEELVIRQVDDGPPKSRLHSSEHGVTCGRLLSPLVAHLKIRSGSVTQVSDSNYRITYKQVGVVF